MPIVTGLSGNEMYCLHLKGYKPGDIVVGNSVYSLGFVGGVTSSLKTLAGGEVTQITEIVSEGRHRSYERMQKEALHRGGLGITGVTSELMQMGTNVEFLSVGSCLHGEGGGTEKLGFSTSADGQGLYCQLDAGFRPVKFVFGNVAYSVGVGGGIMGMMKSLQRGEVTQFSDVFNHTRHLALERITREATQAGANSVVGIMTSIMPFMGLQEMVMIGTASYHDALGEEHVKRPVTSDLTSEEMWGLIHMGWMPIQLVLGVSIYSLGFVGGLSAFFKGFVRGEINELTTLIYDARQNALARIAQDAAACGADDVVGIKTYVYSYAGLLEFMAMGTAVKRMEGVETASDQLPPQAIIKDTDTFVNLADRPMIGVTNLNAAVR
jgi:uncharacterized protein YbjQ (UPF0145 family)